MDCKLKYNLPFSSCRYCSDIDECEMNDNICLNGKCHNTRGSYTCNCDPGYCVPQGQMICVGKLKMISKFNSLLQPYS